MGRPGEDQTIREPLGVALDDELRRIELVIARVWQVFAACAVVGALVVAATISRPLGLWTSLVALVLLAWFSTAVFLWHRGRGGRWLVLASTVVESAMPWVSLVVLVVAQGAAYALGSWLPPMLFAALIVASTVRLRPITPLLIGISGGVAFMLLYFVVARSGLTPEVAAQPLYRLGTQVTRAVSLVLGGALGMLVARGLRGVIGRAESAARAQDLFGKYRLLRQVASGGMGTVHEALYCPEGGFERLVAVKRIHPHLAEQASFVQAFRSEAELSARLVQQNIVQVFDFGRVGDTYFLAMEYVDGMTLASFMRRMAAAGRALPPSLVAHVGCEVLAGLDYSHTSARGSDGRVLRVIHRDLSPANVLLSRAGEVKISDFGLARALFDAASGRTKTVAGHVGYMAPEQALSHPFDERSDLYGLGVMLWELLAGRRLFLRDSEAATLLALVSDPIIPISALRSELEPAWEGVLARALERDPEQRFASASEMAAALEPLRSRDGRRDADELAKWVAEAAGLPERRADGGTSDDVETAVLVTMELARSAPS